tara:strand:- start:49 stop:219 length:171 start_codon:yes stop_codon:yes gene_type:complete
VIEKKVFEDFKKTGLASAELTFVNIELSNESLKNTLFLQERSLSRKRFAKKVLWIH